MSESNEVFENPAAVNSSGDDGSESDSGNHTLVGSKSHDTHSESRAQFIGSRASDEDARETTSLPGVEDVDTSSNDDIVRVGNFKCSLHNNVTNVTT